MYWRICFQLLENGPIYYYNNFNSEVDAQAHLDWLILNAYWYDLNGNLHTEIHLIYKEEYLAGDGYE